MSPSITRAQLQSLRLKYNAAYTAGCAGAFSRAGMHGGAPSAALLQTEANALRELHEARANPLAAITRHVWRNS